MRVGIGYDIHSFIDNKDLYLGGIKIEHDKGLKAHSDGDVCLHALSDAILGAIAYKDIGEIFKDNDDNNKNLDSSIIVRHVISIMKSKNYKINNIDVNIICEKPKLFDYKDMIRENIANLVETSVDNVSVKARTNEKLDSIGENKAIASQVIVSVVKNDE